MARQRKGGTVAPGLTITPTGAATAEEDPRAPDDQTADQLAKGADEGQRAPRARITRWNDRMRTYATLDHVSAVNVDEDWIRSEYGGGKYLVYYWGTMQDGTFGYLKKMGKEFIIDDSVPFKGSREGRAATGAIHNGDGTVAAPAPSAPSSGQNIIDMGILQIFSQMQAMQQMQMQIMKDASEASRAAMARPATPGIEAWLPAVMPMVSAIITGLMSRKDPVELATQIAALREKAPAGGLGEFEAMLDLAERMARRMSGDKEEDLSLLGVVKELAPKALDTMNRFAETRPQPAPAPPARLPAAPQPAFAAAPQPPTPVAPQEPPTPSDEWTPFEGQIAQLVALAQSGSEAPDVAAMAMVMIPAAGKGQLREWLAQTDPEGAFAFEDAIFKRFPTMAQFPAWFRELCTELRLRFGLITEDDLEDEPGDDSPAAGAPAAASDEALKTL